MPDERKLGDPFLPPVGVDCGFDPPQIVRLTTEELIAREMAERPGMTENAIREEFGLPPVEGGDEPQP